MGPDGSWVDKSNGTLKAFVAALVVAVACASLLFSGATSRPLGATSVQVPVVTMNPLSQSVVNSGSLTFTAAASGSPAPTVQWQVSVNVGSTWIGMSGATTTTFTTGTLTALEDGWEVRAVFTNSSGTATSNAAAITVTPTTSVVKPSKGATVSGSQTLDALASSGVKQVHYDLTGGSLSDVVIATASSTAYGWVASWNTTAVPNGTYTLQSVAIYASGGSGTSPGVIVTVNNPPPTTSVLIPAKGAIESGKVSLSASASSRVTSVKFELSGGPENDTVIATAAPSLYGWLAAWNSSTVPNGTYSLQSVASYAGGVSGFSPAVAITVKNQPATAVLAPSNGATVSGGSAVLDASASSAAGITSVAFEVSGGTLSNQLIATATPTAYGWFAQWNTTTVPNGTYSLKSVATDTNAATATSAPTTVIVNNPLSIFDDEFQGSTLSSAWTAAAGPGDASNNEQECFSPQNVTLSGGVLQEKAQVGSMSNCDCPPSSTSACGYISGAVQWTSLSFTYGTVSVRAKFSGGQGTWPAIWLLGSECQSPTWLQNNCPWPAPGSNEVDIAEILQSNLTAVNEQIHTEDSSGTWESPGCTAAASDVSQNWHVYTLIWAPGSLTWQIDGVQTCQITSYVPTTPMFLIINTAVGGVGGGTVKNSTLPQTTQIDYVRVTPS
jgi:beta-glucanase (GH16 family)